jgi:LacI family transcriptional regulator
MFAVFAHITIQSRPDGPGVPPEERPVATRRVAVVMQPTRPYCRAIVRGVATVSAQAGWDCVLFPAEAPPPVELAGFVHGAIGYLADPALADHARRARVPVVDISPVGPDAQLPRVCTDELAVGRLAAEHLQALGLSHFAFIGTRADYLSALRERGFAQALGAAGLRCHAYHDGAPRARGAPESLEQWVRRLPKPLGVLASTDARAFDLLAACRKLKVPVPASLAVLGVDNDEVFCELANPTLSSVALPAQRIGYEGARLLDSLMAGRAAPPRPPLLLPPEGVVSRRSTGLPALLDPDVAAAVRYIRLHVGDGLHVDDVVREVQVSRRSLEQRFLKALGRTPAAEIRRAQVDVAMRMLADTDEPMARVAAAAGFSNAKQFSASFHHETGLTPRDYRRRARGA